MVQFILSVINVGGLFVLTAVRHYTRQQTQGRLLSVFVNLLQLVYSIEFLIYDTPIVSDMLVKIVYIFKEGRALTDVGQLI